MTLLFVSIAGAGDGLLHQINRITVVINFRGAVRAEATTRRTKASVYTQVYTGVENSGHLGPHTSKRPQAETALTKRIYPPLSTWAFASNNHPKFLRTRLYQLSYTQLYNFRKLDGDLQSKKGACLYRHEIIGSYYAKKKIDSKIKTRALRSAVRQAALPHRKLVSGNASGSFGSGKTALNLARVLPIIG